MISRSLLALVGALALVGSLGPGSFVDEAEARSRKKSKPRKVKKAKVSKGAKKPAPPEGEDVAAKAKPEAAPANPEQAEADRHFKSGVTLYKEAKFTEALAEFERAYEIAPHPLVLYNIAGCHRELSNYAESVKYSRRFLEEGKGVVAKSRLATAQSELDSVLARIARVTVIGPDGAELLVDSVSLGTFPLEMPLILPPGEHRLLARAEGFRDAERTMRLASGDQLDVTLTMAALPKEAPPSKKRPPKVVATRSVDIDEREDFPSRRAQRTSHRRFSIGGGYGSNMNDAEDTGAGTARLAVRLGTRFELGVEGIFGPNAVVPSLRLRLLGDSYSVHLIAAVPVQLPVDDMDETFVAGAGGLGFRVHLNSRLALRLEGYVSYAGKEHGTTYPAFVGGELWF